jgi:hypothetical protein
MYFGSLNMKIMVKLTYWLLFSKKKTLFYLYTK